MEDGLGAQRGGGRVVGEEVVELEQQQREALAPVLRHLFIYLFIYCYCYYCITIMITTITTTIIITVIEHTIDNKANQWAAQYGTRGAAAEMCGTAPPCPQSK